MPTILTVDDEEGIRSFLADSLAAPDAVILTAPDGEAALRLLEDHPVDLMLLDLRMPGPLDGMAVLRRARALWPDMQVVVLTAYGTVANAVEAMRLGAFDFLEKPLESPDAVRRMVRRALNWRGRLPARPAQAALAATDDDATESSAARIARHGWLRRLLRELRRRHVYQVAGTYVAIALATLQIAQLVVPVLPLPGWSYAALVALAIGGMPVVLVLSWIYDVSVTRTSGVALTSHR